MGYYLSRIQSTVDLWPTELSHHCYGAYTSKSSPPPYLLLRFDHLSVGGWHWTSSILSPVISKLSCQNFDTNWGSLSLTMDLESLRKGRDVGRQRHATDSPNSKITDHSKCRRIYNQQQIVSDPFHLRHSSEKVLRSRFP